MEKHLVRKQQISVFRLEFCSHRSSISMQLRTLYFFLALTFLHTQFMPSFRQRKVMLVKRRKKESPNPTRPPFCKHRVLPPHLPPACPLHPKTPWVKKQVLHCSVDVVTQRLLNLSSDHKKYHRLIMSLCIGPSRKDHFAVKVCQWQMKAQFQVQLQMICVTSGKSSYL